jgi:hypothetical protein
MKKAEIINSKHVDHIENEKDILEKITHPFVVTFTFYFSLLLNTVRVLWHASR